MYYTAQPKKQSDEDRALLNDMWGPGLTRSRSSSTVVESLTPGDEADTVLVKWRCSTIHDAAGADAERDQPRSTLITGVYAHMRSMTTATDAFMRDMTSRSFLADALADFSRRRAPDVAEIVASQLSQRGDDRRAAAVPSGNESRRCVADVLPLLDESDEPMDDENLIDFGLD
ncbi:hypothetical protein ACNKHS_03040 [Shigella flexneri]